MPTVRAESFAGLSALENERIGQRDDRFFRSLAAREATRENVQRQENEMFQNTVGLVGLLNNIRNQRIEQGLSAQRQQQAFDLGLLNQAVNLDRTDKLSEKDINALLVGQDREDRRFGLAEQRAAASQRKADWTNFTQLIASGTAARRAAKGFPDLPPEMVQAGVDYEKDLTEQEEQLVDQITRLADQANSRLGVRTKAADMIAEVGTTNQEEDTVDKTAMDSLVRRLHDAKLPIPKALSTMTSPADLLQEAERFKNEERDALSKTWGKVVSYDPATDSFVPILPQLRFAKASKGAIDAADAAALEPEDEDTGASAPMRRSRGGTVPKATREYAATALKRAGLSWPEAVKAVEPGGRLYQVLLETPNIGIQQLIDLYLAGDATR